MDEAVAHLRGYSFTLYYMTHLQVVADEIIRLRRHSDALARLLRELAPIQVQPTDTGDSEVAALLTGMLNHILASPEELDLIARAILEAPGEGPGPTVDG